MLAANQVECKTFWKKTESQINYLQPLVSEKHDIFCFYSMTIANNCSFLILVRCTSLNAVGNLQDIRPYYHNCLIFSGYMGVQLNWLWAADLPQRRLYVSMVGRNDWMGHRISLLNLHSRFCRLCIRQSGWCHVCRSMSSFINTVKLKSIYFEDPNIRIIKTVEKYLVYKFLLNLLHFWKIFHNFILQYVYD